MLQVLSEVTFTYSLPTIASLHSSPQQALFACQFINSYRVYIAGVPDKKDTKCSTEQSESCSEIGKSCKLVGGNALRLVKNNQASNFYHHKCGSQHWAIICPWPPLLQKAVWCVNIAFVNRSFIQSSKFFDGITCLNAQQQRKSKTKKETRNAAKHVLSLQDVHLKVQWSSSENTDAVMWDAMRMLISI